mmetsp:Transcript_25854/g.54572  ORF Transcript_25854/g.54572 Transcript_25854/m.54572 type:complete len:290 (-) Transcript_25854:9-878(-)
MFTLRQDLHALRQSPKAICWYLPHFVKSNFRIVGLACSMTRPSLESIVLSMVMLPSWQASTTPPRQVCPWAAGAELGPSGSLLTVSKESSQSFFEPVSAMMILEYSVEALLRHADTIWSSQARQRTCTLSSRSINKPCTMSFVMNSLFLASFVISCINAALLSSLSFPSTSCRLLIFSNLDLLMAEERAIAFCVSISFAFLRYSCRILSFVEFTTLSFSMLNSWSAFVLISSALSLASFMMNCVICRICFWVSLDASMASLRCARRGKPDRFKTPAGARAGNKKGVEAP